MAKIGVSGISPKITRKPKGGECLQNNPIFMTVHGSSILFQQQRSISLPGMHMPSLNSQCFFFSPSAKFSPDKIIQVATPSLSSSDLQLT